MNIQTIITYAVLFLIFIVVPGGGFISVAYLIRQKFFKKNVKGKNKCSPQSKD